MSNSYRRIFKSTALIGATQVINILLGIVRTKVLAVLPGLSGMGIAGMYQSATGQIGTPAGCGIGSAWVRQIAEAVGMGEGSLSRLAAAMSGILASVIWTKAEMGI